MASYTVSSPSALAVSFSYSGTSYGYYRYYARASGGTTVIDGYSTSTSYYTTVSSSYGGTTLTCNVAYSSTGAAGSYTWIGAKTVYVTPQSVTRYVYAYHRDSDGNTIRSMDTHVSPSSGTVYGSSYAESISGTSRSVRLVLGTGISSARIAYYNYGYTFNYSSPVSQTAGTGNLTFFLYYYNRTPYSGYNTQTSSSNYYYVMSGQNFYVYDIGFATGYNGWTLSVSGSTGSGTSYTTSGSTSVVNANIYPAGTVTITITGVAAETGTITAATKTADSLGFSWTKTKSTSGTVNLLDSYGSLVASKSISGTSGGATFTGLSNNTTYYAQLVVGSSSLAAASSTTQTLSLSISYYSAARTSLTFSYSSNSYNDQNVKLYLGTSLIETKTASYGSGYISFTGLSPGTTYTAIIYYGTTSWDDARGKTTGVTGTITAATTGADKLGFSWTFSETESGSVELYVTSTGSLVASKSISGTSGGATFNGLDPSTNYTAQLRDSSYNLVASTTGSTQAVSMSISYSSATKTSLTFTYNMNSYSSQDIKLYQGGSFIETKTVTNQSGSVTFNSLSPNTTYTAYIYFGVTAKDWDSGTTSSVTGTITFNAATMTCLSFNWTMDYNGSGTVSLYTSGSSLVETKSVSGLSGTVSFTGLTHSTTYTAIIYYSSSELARTTGTTADGIALFYWKGSQANDDSYIYQGADVTSAIDNAKWNLALSKIRIINPSAYVVDQIEGDPISAYYFNQFKNAVAALPGAGDVPSDKSSGSAILASEFNTGNNSVKVALNNAIETYNSTH